MGCALVEVVQGGRVSGGGMAQRKGGVLPTRPLSETPLTSVEVTVHLYCTQAVQPVWNSLAQDGINASIHPYAETWQSTPLCTYSTYLCSSIRKIITEASPSFFSLYRIIRWPNTAVSSSTASQGEGLLRHKKGTCFTLCTKLTLFMYILQKHCIVS